MTESAQFMFKLWEVYNVDKLIYKMAKYKSPLPHWCKLIQLLTN